MIHVRNYFEAGVLTMTYIPSTAVALLLAFLVRWGLLEAFVVPTGAMAPTIYGEHVDVTCPNCGKSYALNASIWRMPGGRKPLHAACPYCSQPSEIEVDAPICPGDKILVDKITRLRRWDLMVFKFPGNRQINYVKRLIGMPGETMEIADGGIFVNGQRLRREPLEQQDMWIPVHDSSRQAKPMLPGSPHWEVKGSASGWKYADGHWKFTGMNAVDDALEFSGRITDQIAYNSTDPSPGYPIRSGLPVGNIRIACDLKQFSGEGGLEFCWEFRDLKVRARISADGKIEMAVSAIPVTVEKGKSPVQVVHGELRRSLSTAEPIGFAVRDGQAYVMQGSRVVATALVGPQDLAAAKAQPKAGEACRLTILASRCNADLSRIVLARDIYYCNLTEIPGADREASWGCTGHPMHLGKGEYFVLGDNSCQSSDSRFWGAVPKDSVIGVGRLTYWPSRRWRFFQ